MEQTNKTTISKQSLQDITSVIKILTHYHNCYKQKSLIVQWLDGYAMAIEDLKSLIEIK